MPKIISQLNKSAPEYGQYREHNLALRDTLKEKLDRIAHGGGEAAEARLRDKGKLPVRERIQHLLDPGSPFLELSALAADGTTTAPLPTCPTCGTTATTTPTRCSCSSARRAPGSLS